MATLVDSDEESRIYNLREMTKSTETALRGISHFSQKLKTTRLRKDKIDLVNSVVSVHGKESPEVFFFGTMFIREWLISLDKATIDLGPESGLDPLLLDRILQSSIQTCVNAINFFKAKGNGDSSLVHASFSLLHVVASMRFSVPVSRSESKNQSQNSLEGLSDLVSSEFLSSLSSDAVGIVLACKCVLAQLCGSRGEFFFIRKDVASFCLEFVEKFEQSGDSSRLLYSVMYLSLTISTPTEIKDYFLSKLFAKHKILQMLCALVLVDVNDKLLLLTLIRFISQALINGIAIIASEDTEEDGDAGFFGIMNTGSGPDKGRIPAVFDAVDIDALDDVFSAYGESDSDPDLAILVALAAVGSCMVEYYGTSNSTRANAVTTSVKKWAFASVTSDQAVINACGLTLVTDLRQFCGEPITGILSVQVFKDCVESLHRLSIERAKEECFEFLRRIAVAAPEAEEECMNFLEVFIRRFNFHHSIMHNELLKKLFFKTITMKDAFSRLLKSLRSPSLITYSQIFVLSRVLLQMITAVRAKGSLQDFVSEFKRAEPASVLVALIQGIHLAIEKEDFDTAEILVAVIQQLAANRSERLDQLLISLFTETDSEAKVRDILTQSQGYKYTPPDLALGERENGAELEGKTVLASFKGKALLYYRFVKSRKEQVKKEEQTDKGDHKPLEEEKEGWLDSAANWFIDFSEEAPEKEEEVAKPKKNKKSSSPSPDESLTENELDSVEKTQKIDTAPAIVAKAKPKVTAPSSSAKSGVIAAKPTGKAIPKTVVKAKSVPAMKASVSTTKKAAMPLPAKAPPTKAASPAEHDVSVEEEGKKKKKKEPDPTGLGEYVDTAALYSAFGGWLVGAEEPKKEKKSKKKEKSEVEDEAAPESKPVAPPAKVAIKSVPKLTSKITAKTSTKIAPKTVPPVIKK